MPADVSVNSVTVADHLAAKIATPAIGGDGEARLYAVSVGGQERWAQIGGDAGAVPRRIGSSEACCIISTIYPQSGSTLSSFGCTATSVGTVGHNHIATTNLSTSCRRWQIQSAATANSACETYASMSLCWRGNAPGLGGFTADFRFSLRVSAALIRGFVGLTSGSPPTALGTTFSPQALTDAVGLQFESGETTWRIGTSDSSGNATRVDLGENFPTTDTAAVYSVSLNAEPNSSVIGWTVIRHDTSPPVVVSGTFATDLPADNALLTPRIAWNNGGTASAISVEPHFIVVEVPLARR